MEVLVVDVRLDLLYDRVRYVVLVVVKEALKEPGRVLQGGLARLPVVIDLRREGKGEDRLWGHVPSTASIVYAHGR